MAALHHEDSVLHWVWKSASNARPHSINTYHYRNIDMTKHDIKPNSTPAAICTPKKTLLSLCLSAALLSACGGTGQDDGSPSSFTQEFSGAVLDGYLARATVFLDSNNNGTRDAWEAFAFTDNNGYYSFNPDSGIDYCADSATAQQQQYCLVSRTGHTNVVVRVDGGYDVLTGEPFLGQLTRCLLYTSPSPRDRQKSRMPSSA